MTVAVLAPCAGVRQGGSRGAEQEEGAAPEGGGPAQSCREAAAPEEALSRPNSLPRQVHTRISPCETKVVCRVRPCTLTQERGKPLSNVFKMCFGVCIPLKNCFAVFSGGGIELTQDNQSSAHDLSARKRHGGALHACVKSTL